MANEKRLIDANALLATGSGIKIAVRRDCRPYEAIRIQGNAFRKAVEQAPTVYAVEVVHGRWECEHETWGQLQCSVCKKQALLEHADGDLGKILLYVTSNYCPNCGAKMDGDGNV